MPKSNSIIQSLRQDHSELSKLILDFRRAIELTHFSQAKEVLGKIEQIAKAHFEFEETYLYPRLRRLVLEITNALRQEIQIFNDFIKKVKISLEKKKLDENKLISLLTLLPAMLESLKECDYLILLSKKFGRQDLEDLSRRFIQCTENSRKEKTR